MAFTTEQVVNMLDTSGESDIDEHHCFLLPHDSETEEDEQQPHVSTPAIPAHQTATSDSSDQENAPPGKIQIFQIIHWFFLPEIMNTIVNNEIFMLHLDGNSQWYLEEIIVAVE